MARERCRDNVLLLFADRAVNIAVVRVIEIA